MKRKHHTPIAEGSSTGVQIIRKLRTAEQLLIQGKTVGDVNRTMEVSAPTAHRSQLLYEGMKAKSDAGH